MRKEPVSLLGLTKRIPSHLSRERRADQSLLLGTQVPATGKSLGLPDPTGPCRQSQDLEPQGDLGIPFTSLCSNSPAWGPKRGTASGQNRTTDRRDAAEPGRRA